MTVATDKVELIRALYTLNKNVSACARAAGCSYPTAKKYLIAAGLLEQRTKRGTPLGQRRPSSRRDEIIAAVEAHAGNQAEAARALGISRQAVGIAVHRERTGDSLPSAEATR